MPQHTQLRIIIIAAGIVAGLAYLDGGARGIGAGDRDLVFSPAVEPRVQLAAASADVPLGGRPTLSAFVARGSLAVALGRRSAIRDFAAVSAALAAVAFAAVLHLAGFAAPAVIVAMLGLSFGNTFWWRGVTYTDDALFPALFFAAVWAALQLQVTRRRSMAILGGVCAVLAIVDFVTPMAGGLLRTPSVPGFIASLTREFTPLGLFLAAIGLAVLLHSQSTRLQAAIVAAALLIWHWWWRSALDPVNVIVVMAGWWAIAVALTWLHAVLSARTRPLLIGVVGAVLVATPVLVRARVSALGGDQPSVQRVRTAYDFPVAAAPEGASVIAESRRFDAALLLSSRLASRPIRIVPQTVDRVAEALAAGGPVLAYDNAAANLERHGFLFERTAIGHVEASVVAGRVPCVDLDDDTWTDVSLLLANGSLIIHGAQDSAPAGVVIRMAAPAPLRVAAVEPRDAGYEIDDVARDAEGVPQLLGIAGSRDPAAHLSSIRLPATGRVSPVTVRFTSPPAYAVATAEDPVATSICPGVQRASVMLASAATAMASVPMNDNAPFGSGWHPVESDPDFFRWTAAPDSSLRIALAKPSAVRVTITATPASRPAQKPTIGLTVNGCRHDVRPMSAGQGDYEWLVEERCWRPGVNQLWIHTSPLISPATFFATHDTRLLGARIGAIRLARQ